MKISTIQYMITFIGLLLSVVSVFMISDFFKSMEKIKTNQIAMLDNETKVEKVSTTVVQMIINEAVTKETTEVKTEPTTKVITTEPITESPTFVSGEEVVYDDLTINELTDKLNRNLGSTIENTGHLFAGYTAQTGLDPYLALAIVLHETGCKWGCSTLVKDCYNVGGIKGSPSCNGGSYKKYDSLEEGVKGYLDVVFNNYYSQGLTTPELMNPKYAASLEWAGKINNYMNAIRES